MEKRIDEAIEYPINTIVNSLLALIVLPFNTIFLLFNQYSWFLSPHINIDL